MQSAILAAVLALFATAAASQPIAGKWKEPTTGISFVAVPGGCFQMGIDEKVDPPADTLWPHLGPARDLAADEKPRHEVCVDTFWMAVYEVRNSDWQRVMGGKGDAADKPRPVSGVSWEDAQAFAARLGELSGGKHRFRLPTEAEWEYACRAGADTEAVPQTSDLIDRAWYGVNEDDKPHPRDVGKLAPNAFGLFDMLGNVWEWVQDDYQRDGYAGHALYNPLVKAGAGGDKVIRGGSHRSEAVHMRCGKRSRYARGAALATIGFRLVRVQ